MKKAIVCLATVMFLVVGINVVDARCVHWNSYGVCDQYVDDAPSGQDNYYRNNTGENKWSDIYNDNTDNNKWRDAINDSSRNHWKDDSDSNGGVIEK